MNKSKTNLYTLALIASAIFGSFYVAGCTSTTSPGTTTPPGAPGALMVLAKNSNTISLMWTRGSGDVDADTVYQGTSLLGTTSGSAMDVTSLQEQTAYTFIVHTAGGNTNSITWMTAERTNGLRIYEVADPSSSDPSGLSLGPQMAMTLPLSQGAAADFVLESYANDPTLPSGISLVASNVHSSGWRDTKVSGKANYIVGGLANNFRSSDYKTEMDTASQNAFDLPNDAVYGTKGSAIIVVKTQDNHLALVEIVPDPSTGKLYSVNGAGYKYVTVNVSYQLATNTGYAARPRPAHSGPIVRMSAR
ncbi:MAG: hypothetical protein Q8922_12295 [Bacteroidota bacterium]|nr:hypothetical protein [Bacteroidota bacterium]MDP4233704.1 hypothetical protein [Bacteroidota bacterium]MDP4242343.1 hypothetical protein [Bacteroidota bacterium]MDP4288704.1 hypothetical protein [Bacteroidota bacterium]